MQLAPACTSDKCSSIQAILVSTNVTPANWARCGNGQMQSKGDLCMKGIVLSYYHLFADISINCRMKTKNFTIRSSKISRVLTSCIFQANCMNKNHAISPWEKQLCIATIYTDKLVFCKMN